MEKKSIRSKQIQVRVMPSEKALLRQVCQQQGINLSDMVRQGLRLYLEKVIEAQERHPDA